ncbi:unnamed protein product, partial [Adineta ricciae]
MSLLDPSCNDGNKNQDETDTDCGGVACGASCPIGKTCSANTDCSNGNCPTSVKKCQGISIFMHIRTMRRYLKFDSTFVFICLAYSCTDGNQNQGESDVDCGGPCSTKCSISRSCNISADCTNSNCNAASHKCEILSCVDGNKNQNETDIDCGGICGSTCTLNKTCSSSADCANSNCNTGTKKCVNPSCNDGNKNQNETDTDCGGVCGATCGVAKVCQINGDCANGNCHTGLKKCQSPSCSDGNQNQNESDIDCGGVCTTKCALNQLCKVNSDCTNGNCYQTNHTCQPYSCSDGNKNQGEGDIDCGGPCNTTLCALYQTCNVNADCVTGNCQQANHTCLPISCFDGNKNQGEIDVDCSGPCSSKCAVNQMCSVNTDSSKYESPSTYSPLAYSCFDGNQNQNESDIDCGGVCTTKCAINKLCKVNSDCTNANCYQTNHSCQPYSCSDGNKNQGEGDVDCGGPCTAALCSLNQTCNVNSDCTNGNCNQYNHTCQ